MEDLPHLSYRSSGRIGAGRLVAIVRSGAAALDDPAPAVTAAHDIRVLFVAMPRLGVDDPEAFGGETPDEEHTAALVRLLRREGASAEAPSGLVGVGEVGWRAIGAAAALGHAVDRIALVAVTVPDSPLDREDAADLLVQVHADTLILAGEDDPRASAEDARWLQGARGGGRVELRSGHGRLADDALWTRVLEHVDPA